MKNISSTDKANNPISTDAKPVTLPVNQAVTPKFKTKPARPFFRPQNIRPISYHGTGHRG